jgi:hypothetical protein
MGMLSSWPLVGDLEGYKYWYSFCMALESDLVLHIHRSKSKVYFGSKILGAI